jgi:hypothetical protein
MRRKQPPVAANWLLNHLTPGERNEALAGDLLEEFQDGRSIGWYWSQVLFAVALGWVREFLARPGILAFGMLWCLLAPAWYVVAESKVVQLNLTGWFSHLAFPWSIVVYLLCMLLDSLTFIWAGVGLYLLIQKSLAGSVIRMRLGRALIVSALVHIACFASLAIICEYLLQPGPALDRNLLTPLRATFDLRMYAMQPRLCSLVTWMATLWALTPRTGVRPRPAE